MQPPTVTLGRSSLAELLDLGCVCQTNLTRDLLASALALYPTPLHPTPLHPTPYTPTPYTPTPTDYSQHHSPRVLFKNKSDPVTHLLKPCKGSCPTVQRPKFTGAPETLRDPAPGSSPTSLFQSLGSGPTASWPFLNHA